MATRRFHFASTEQLNLAGDLLLLCGACFLAALDGEQLHWKVALVMAATASAIWVCGARALRQYDPNNGRGLVGDVALTVLLLVAVIAPMALLRYVSPRYAMVTEISRFL